MIAHGITINYPVEPTVVHDHIGVAILVEKRRERRETLVDVAPQQDAAARHDVIGDKQVDVLVVETEEQAAPESADGYASVALVEVEDIAVAARIVEFGCERFGDCVDVRLLAEVDTRLNDLDAN